MAKISKVDLVLNLCGLQGSQPSIMIIETLKKMDAGKVVEIVGDDLAVDEMAKRLCREQGYSLLAASRKMGLVRCLVKK